MTESKSSTSHAGGPQRLSLPGLSQQTAETGKLSAEGGHAFFRESLLPTKWAIGMGVSFDLFVRVALVQKHRREWPDRDEPAGGAKCPTRSAKAVRGQSRQRRAGAEPIQR